MDLIKQLILLATYLIHTTGQSRNSHMEGFIVHGQDTRIEDFPHSVFLAVGCLREGEIENFGCGGSIINQGFILTAAHCYERCDPKKSILVVCFGSTTYSDGITIPSWDIKMHEQYQSRGLHYDIGLVKLFKPLTFSTKTKKVYLMKNPPVDKVAEVAGWGLVDEENPVETVTLKLALQKIMPRSECLNYFGFLPEHTFCAGSLGGYAAEGDSGSALVVRKFIQIGLVSYKDMNVSTSLIVYTNVSAYYDWIMTSMEEMSCSETD